jgi:predicted MFS family arabinose efflux permease
MNRSLRLQITAFAFIRTVFNTSFRIVYPFLPILSRGLGVSITTFSLALTSRQIAGTFGPFLAILTESRGRRFGMLMGLSLFTAGVAIVVLWPIFPVFVVSLILTTLGKYMFDPHMQGYLGDQIPYERRGLAVAATELGWSLAFFIGIPITGFLISREGWVSPFWVFTILGGVAIFLITRLIPAESNDQDAWNAMWFKAAQVLRYGPALAGLAVGLWISAANEVINLVFGVWLEDSFGLQIMALGGATAAIGLAEFGGESLMGIVTDKFGKERSVGIGIIANCLAAAIFPYLGRSLSGAVVALFLFYITFEFTLVAMIPLMTEIMPTARVTLMAFNVAGISVGRAIGAVTGPRLYGLGISSSALAAIGFNLLALLALYWLKKVMVNSE